MRALRALIVATAMVAALLPAAVASAGPHAPPEDPHTDCVVNGTVTLTNGVTPNRQDDHYTFIDTALRCETLTGTKDYGGTWEVRAEGDTTDENHQNKGENCEFGGSAKLIDTDGDGLPDQEFHSGDLVADRVAGGSPKNLDGGVHFVRVGTTVLADGPLQDTTNGTPHYFHAELEFVPTMGTCTKDDPIVEAALVGDAVIGNGKRHDCLGDKSDKKVANDDHCI